MFSRQSPKDDTPMKAKHDSTKSFMNPQRVPIKVAPKDDTPMKSKHDSTNSVMNPQRDPIKVKVEKRL